MTELGKTITLWRGLGLAICMLIGTGILALPGLALDAGNVYEAVLGWLLISLVALPLIHICARLGLKFPSTSGLARYAEEAVGSWGGYAVSYLVAGSFLFGLPAVALVGAEYVRQLLPLSALGVALFAILLIILMTLSNLAGIRAVSLINYAALAVLFLLLSLLVLFNLNFLSAGLEIALEALKVGLNPIMGADAGEGMGAIVDLKHLWTIAALLFWAFLGWENLSFSLGEIKDPEKNVPRLYWLSFVLVTSIYLLLAFISAGAKAAGVPLQGAAGLSGLVRFTPGGDLLVWFMVIVVAANACSWNFTASRLIFSGGRTGIFPESLGKLSVRGIPVPALAVLFISSFALVLASYFFRISVSDLILLVNQNFVFLYAFIILAYWKSESGWQRWVFSALSLASLAFLVSGFTWEIIYPIFLIGLGYYRWNVSEKEKLLEKEKQYVLSSDESELLAGLQH
ncbi:amino acid permease [Methanosarcina sp. MTP4]|uniref:APC family permease n=1 Tax=Methanosarcina sp. MTP4 TaxID=1434100 RepID=UPI00064E6F18